MREEPGRARTCPPRALGRAGQLAVNVLTTGLSITSPRITTRLITCPSTTRINATRLSAVALIIVGGLLAAGCGAGAPATFRPAGAGAATPAPALPSTRTGNPAGPAHHAAGPLAWPPFGGNVRVVMPGWLPADPGEVPAVIAAKNFLLAFLYAEYRGNQDDRWTGYVSGDALGALKANLSRPSVTTESFTGTILFSHMRAYPDPTTTDAIDVSECFDNSTSRNTGLATGKIVADRIPARQHYYMNTDVMAKANGRWTVISVYPVIYYPQAQECKP
jgi:hypothetical protein